MPAESLPCRSERAAFFRIHALLVNIDRGVGRLLGLLHTNSAALGIIHWTTPLISLRVRSSALYILGSIALKCAFARVMKLLGNHERFVFLPDCGELALCRFPGGMRIFDLGNRTITNLNGPGSDADRARLAGAVAHQQALAELGVAPRILDRDRADGYVEELCDGAPLKTQAWWEADVFRAVTGKARLIQDAQAPVRRDAADAVDELQRCLDTLRAACGGDDGAWLTSEVETACAHIDASAPLELFLSHGDLARRNILLRRDGGVIFIDWQTVDYRSKDYDIYNYHFSIIEDGCGRHMSESTVFDYLDEALGPPAPERAVDRLRRFRVDFLITRMKHFALPGAEDRSRVSRVIAQMREYAESFSRYEERCRVSGNTRQAVQTAYSR